MRMYKPWPRIEAGPRLQAVYLIVLIEDEGFYSMIYGIYEILRAVDLGTTNNWLDQHVEGDLHLNV